MGQASAGAQARECDGEAVEMGEVDGFRIVGGETDSR